MAPHYIDDFEPPQATSSSSSIQLQPLSPTTLAPPVLSPTATSFASVVRSLQKPFRKISAPAAPTSSNNLPTTSHPQNHRKSLDEAEAESDRRNLFSKSVKLPNFAKAHQSAISPIKVQISPAEQSHQQNVQIPSAVRITRRHTEQMDVTRKYTPPAGHQQAPAHVPTVSRYPESTYDHPRQETIVEEDSTTGAGLPALPLSYNRTKLPPLQVTSSTLNGANNGHGSLSAINTPKPVSGLIESGKDKGFAADTREKVSKYRVFFKCFFVVLFLSIPVVIFVVMMALSGGFSPYQAVPNNSTNTISNSTDTVADEDFVPLGTTTLSTAL